MSLKEIINSPHQLKILKTLVERGGLSIKSLSRVSFIHPNDALRALQSLERMNLITKHLNGNQVMVESNFESLILSFDRENGLRAFIS